MWEHMIARHISTHPRDIEFGIGCPIFTFIETLAIISVRACLSRRSITVVTPSIIFSNARDCTWFYIDHEWEHWSGYIFWRICYYLYNIRILYTIVAIWLSSSFWNCTTACTGVVALASPVCRLLMANAENLSTVVLNA